MATMRPIGYTVRRKISQSNSRGAGRIDAETLEAVEAGAGLAESP
jgi:hypothetical protein